MNQSNCKIIQEAVATTGDYLKDKLPILQEHEHRNSYAHLWRSIKEKMGMSYKDCCDADVETILGIIAWHRENKI